MMNRFWKWVYKKATQAYDPLGTTESTIWRNDRRITQIEHLLKMDRNKDYDALTTSGITGDLGSVIRTVRPYEGELHKYSEIKKGKLE